MNESCYVSLERRCCLFLESKIEQKTNTKTEISNICDLPMVQQRQPIRQLSIANLFHRHLFDKKTTMKLEKIENKNIYDYINPSPMISVSNSDTHNAARLVIVNVVVGVVDVDDDDDVDVVGSI